MNENETNASNVTMAHWCFLFVFQPQFAFSQNATTATKKVSHPCPTTSFWFLSLSSLSPLFLSLFLSPRPRTSFLYQNNQLVHPSISLCLRLGAQCPRLILQFQTQRTVRIHFTVCFLVSVSNKRNETKRNETNKKKKKTHRVSNFSCSGLIAVTLAIEEMGIIVLKSNSRSPKPCTTAMKNCTELKTKQQQQLAPNLLAFSLSHNTPRYH